MKNNTHVLLVFILMLSSFMLFGCTEEPLCNSVQDERVKKYYDNVVEKLNYTGMEKDCIVLRVDYLKPGTIMQTVININGRKDIIIDDYKLNIYQNIADGYSYYLEAVMIQEVMHALYHWYATGLEDDRLHVNWKEDMTESDIDYLYIEARKIIEEINKPIFN